jgi:hypothetical protein
MSGPLDFTGQNIEDSYQRVLQISDSSVYDGTGSLVIIASAVTSSYPINVTGSSLYSTDPATSDISNNNVIAFGSNAGNNTNNAPNSNFLGNGAGSNATDASFSNFIGYQAGSGATGAGSSNFLGPNAGKNATDASTSNFIGNGAGFEATSANNSNFLGNGAGSGATGAGSSNFIGASSGFNAIDASNANFIGNSAGGNATNASNSNFLGNGAGSGATNASFSNFIGYRTGEKNIITSHSIFIGHRAGINYSNKVLPSLGDGVGPNNIIIGNNITLEQNRIDSINIGAIIFATGSYAQIDDDSYAFSGSVENGKVGINVVNPQHALDVSGSINFTGEFFGTIDGGTF